MKARWHTTRSLALKNLIGLLVIFGLFFASQSAWAQWQDPDCDPTTDINSCTVSAPLNVSSIAQTKIGALTIGGLLTLGGGLTVNGSGDDVRLPDNSIEGSEITDGTIREADVFQHNGSGNGLDDSEIDDEYVQYDKKTEGTQTVQRLLRVMGQGGGIAELGVGGAAAAVFKEAPVVAQDGSYYKGDGFELVNVSGSVNEAANPKTTRGTASIPEMRTAVFYGQLDRRDVTNDNDQAVISLPDYGIPTAGYTVVPISLKAMKCPSCTDTNSPWVPFDELTDVNLSYDRCINGTLTNRITIENNDTLNSDFVVQFQYALVPSSGSLCTAPGYDFTGATD
ncbi:MAG: hypothetical protein A3F54_00615 [Candidatus Kerfeldbacteria bacterium RIFCSPHIGHO2_12_FULL_48_17]|uniref:Uncharacterized protein n=1 Tax=Candidatus Kerfeldbacteria bacterium RIFCSPHIGHO2_12_FULL_48_17 TaxID=1798542 RepID=A0A1G2B6V8_9BACT|nr:MAG: hypothetical protein A3F54_00615 [Candidatus Kerfeldbacteria bacterium RIFCSPHIGHO2_12_FULL_48_17]